MSLRGQPEQEAPVMILAKIGPNVNPQSSFRSMFMLVGRTLSTPVYDVTILENSSPTISVSGSLYVNKSAH